MMSFKNIKYADVYFQHNKSGDFYLCLIVGTFHEKKANVQ